MAKTTRTIEIFSAGCPLCERAVKEIREAACPSCEIEVRDMGTPEVQERAAALGVRAVPAVAINGTLSDCCTSKGVDLNVLRAAGLGQPLD